MEMNVRTPKFDHPPLNEVVFSVAFERLTKFTAPYVGIMWQECFVSDYPTHEIAPLIVSTPEDLDPQTAQFPRIWLISKDGRTLIQFQSDRFIFNWRRVAEGDQYSAYDEIVGAFRDAYTKFEKFVSARSLGAIVPKRFELAYINHIPMSADRGVVTNVAAVFPDLAWRSGERAFTGPVKGLLWRTIFDMPKNQGTLSATVTSGAKTPNAPAELFVLELKSEWKAEPSSDVGRTSMWEWFRLAHDSICWCFVDLTSPQLQSDVWHRTA